MTATLSEGQSPTVEGVSATGVILAGTHPWTNSAFDTLLPRPLVPVAHRPLIAYALSWLREAGIETVAVCGNRETRLLESRLVNHVPVGMTLSYLEDPMPRGAAGCLRDAVMSDAAETFVVTDGTSVPNVDLVDLLQFHRRSGAAATVVTQTEARRQGDSCGLRAPSGIYVFERRALELVPARGFYDIKEHLIPRLHRSGEAVVMYASAGTAPRVLGAATYLAVNEWVVEQMVAAESVPEGYLRIGESLVHCEAEVAADAVMAGPVLIGPGARILPRAVLVGPTSIGRNATVKNGALVSRSAVWRRSVIGSHASTDRCIIADDADVGSEHHAFRTVVPGHSRTRPRHMTSAAPSLFDVAAWRKHRVDFGRHAVDSNLAVR